MSRIVFSESQELITAGDILYVGGACTYHGKADVWIETWRVIAIDEMHGCRLRASDGRDKVCLIHELSLMNLYHHFEELKNVLLHQLTEVETKIQEKLADYQQQLALIKDRTAKVATMTAPTVEETK